MSRLTAFDRKSAERIAHVVRKVERDAGEIPGRPRAHKYTGIGMGIAAGNAVVIRGIPEGGDYGMVLQVQRITLDNEGVWSPTGETIDLPTYPFTPAIFWSKFVLPEGSIPQCVGDVQPTVMIDGVECVGLFVPFFPVTVRSDEPHRGPRPV